MPYVELHARSAFSFLRAGSLPESLVAEAARLEIPGVALCDRDGVYGAVRLHMSGKEAGVRAIVGAELTMEDGSVVPVLVATRAGYRGLCRLLTTAHLRAEKGEGRVAWKELSDATEGLIALTGDEEGPMRRAWLERGPAAAAAAGSRLSAAFGPDRLCVEIQRHRIPGEERCNAFLVDWARAMGLPTPPWSRQRKMPRWRQKASSAPAKSWFGRSRSAKARLVVVARIAADGSGPKSLKLVSGSGSVVKTAPSTPKAATEKGSRTNVSSGRI